MRVADAAPLRFLIAIVALWTLGRGAILLGWQPSAPAALAAETPPTPPHDPDLQLPLDPVVVTPRSTIVATELQPARSITVALDDMVEDRATPPGPDTSPIRLAMLVAAPSATHETYRRADGGTEIAAVAAVPQARPASRLSGSVWAFVRGGGHATALSPGGQIGGGQAGARLLYRLDGAGRLAASARLSHTIGGLRQSEAAIGLDWKPVAGLPVHVMVDRRIALDGGGRNAWALGAAGGVYALPLGGHWRFDGYGEAGVVGTRRRDLYADGAGRIARAIDLGGGRSLAVGGGLWAAAQPGASRVDIGPSAVLRLPVSGRTMALALDWRGRVAGKARPGSGVALTAGVDF